MKIQKGFPPSLRRSTAELYFAAFEGKIGGILGRTGKGTAFVELVVDPTHAICAIDDNGTKLLGLAGFKTASGAMVGGELSDLAKIYGWFGALWRGLILSVLERDLEDHVLLMDGIAVADGERGKGIGTKLLYAIFAEAEKLGKTEIRLDVIDTNPKARALYERLGFVATGKEALGPLKYVFGFSMATKMVKTV